MGDSVSVDPAILRQAAGRLNGLYDTAGTTLRVTDQAITDSRDGWRDTAATAFSRFTDYLDDRRATLQRQLAELSESLNTTATTLQTQDQSRAATTNQLQSSLDL
ncbi:WXG100 family type VII secretion target [Nocardia sp. CS682]|uniref:WXG100 family type VII secretion target n=1 Tax=Nocardia sp. CS682 TaxID=1047172 RepID=UPI001074A796|nr:WXG100 family type VII secretion target [Nocardia sp. CS682]QBS43584.1 ESX-1 secretion-associated protein [Nocardia sp. CS682]